MPVDTLDTNLIASRAGKQAEAAPPLPATPVSPRKKILKLLAYCLIFLVAFLFFVIMKIPDSMVTNLTLGQLNSNTPYSWRADRVGFRVFFLPHLTFEKLELEPKFGVGTSLSVASMNIYPSLLSLIPSGKAPSFRGSFSAEAYQGQFSGNFTLGTDVALAANVANLDLAKLTPLAQSGLDLRGMITSLVADLTMEAQKLSRAGGTVHLLAKNLVFDPASLQLPIAIPILDLGPAEIQGKILRGKLKLEKVTIGNATKDLELRVEGDIQLAEPVNFSRVDLHLRLKPSDKLLKALPSLQGMLTSLAAKRADGFYGMKLSGSFAAMGIPQPDPN
jgi:type II secretion system protein N